MSLKTDKKIILHGEKELIELYPLMKEYMKIVIKCEKSALDYIDDESEDLFEIYENDYEESFNCSFMKWLLNQDNFKKAATTLLKKIDTEDFDDAVREAETGIFARLVAIEFSYVIDLAARNDTENMIDRMTPEQKATDKLKLKKLIVNLESSAEGALRVFSATASRVF
jgi:hypothetical protein